MCRCRGWWASACRVSTGMHGAAAGAALVITGHKIATLLWLQHHDQQKVLLVNRCPIVNRLTLVQHMPLVPNLGHAKVVRTRSMPPMQSGADILVHEGRNRMVTRSAPKERQQMGETPDEAPCAAGPPCRRGVSSTCVSFSAISVVACLALSCLSFPESGVRCQVPSQKPVLLGR